MAQRRLAGREIADCSSRREAANNSPIESDAVSRPVVAAGPGKYFSVIITLLGGPCGIVRISTAGGDACAPASSRNLKLTSAAARVAEGGGSIMGSESGEKCLRRRADSDDVAVIRLGESWGHAAGAGRRVFRANARPINNARGSANAWQTASGDDKARRANHRCKCI